MVRPEIASNLIESLSGLVRRGRVVTARGQHLGMLASPMGALLSHIACAEGHRQSLLAEELKVTQSALSRQVAHAESLGYVRRCPDPVDGRAFLLSLTESGADALRVHRQAILEWALRSMEDWTEDEVIAITAGLDKLLASIVVDPVPPH